MGESFFPADEAAAELFIQSERERKEGELAAKVEALDSMQAELKALKGRLYNKFGKHINLEE